MPEKFVIQNSSSTQFGQLSPLENAVLDEIDDVAKYSEDWDGYDSLSPDPDAVLVAKSLVTQYPQLFQGQFKPDVSADEDGRITLEWHQNPKTLVLFVGARETIVVQSWGVQDKIEDSLLNAPNELPKLCDWLLAR